MHLVGWAVEHYQFSKLRQYIFWFQTIIAAGISYGVDLEKKYNAGIVKSIPSG